MAVKCFMLILSFVAPEVTGNLGRARTGKAKAQSPKVRNLEKPKKASTHSDKLASATHASAHSLGVSTSRSSTANGTKRSEAAEKVPLDASKFIGIASESASDKPRVEVANVDSAEGTPLPRWSLRANIAPVLQRISADEDEGTAVHSANVIVHTIGEDYRKAETTESAADHADNTIFHKIEADAGDYASAPEAASPASTLRYCTPEEEALIRAAKRSHALLGVASAARVAPRRRHKVARADRTPQVHAASKAHSRHRDLPVRPASASSDKDLPTCILRPAGGGEGGDAGAAEGNAEIPAGNSPEWHALSNSTPASSSGKLSLRRNDEASNFSGNPVDNTIAATPYLASSATLPGPSQLLNATRWEMQWASQKYHNISSESLAKAWAPLESASYQPDDMGLEGVAEHSSNIPNVSNVRNKATPDQSDNLAVPAQQPSPNVTTVSSQASTASQASASSPPVSTVPGPSANLEGAMEVARADSEKYHKTSSVSDMVDGPSDAQLDQSVSSPMQPAAAIGDDGQPASEEAENMDVVRMVDDLRDMMTRVSNKTTALVDEVEEEVGNCTTALKDILVAQSTTQSAAPTLDVNASDWVLELSHRLAPVESRMRVEATELRAQTYESYDHRIRDLSYFGHSLAHKVWRSAAEVSKIMDKAVSLQGLAAHATNGDSRKSWLSELWWSATTPTRQLSTNQTELAYDVAKVIADIADGNATLIKATDILSTAVHRAERLLEQVQEFASKTYEGVAAAIKVEEGTKEGASNMLDVLTTIHASSLTPDILMMLRRVSIALYNLDDTDSSSSNKRLDAMMEAEREFLDSRYRLVSLELDGLFRIMDRLFEQIKQVKGTF